MSRVAGGTWLPLAGLAATAVLTLLPVPRTGLWPRPYLAHLPMPTPAAWNAPAEPPATASPPDAAGIGVPIGVPTADADRETVVRHARGLGARWARLEVPWALVEPQDGQQSWDVSDAAVNGLRRGGLRILGLLGYWTSWAPPYSDAALRGFERYAEAAARRYRGRVDAWEVWNEPNDSFWHDTPERYVKFLAAAWNGVKRGSPNALVIAGSTSGVDLPFVRRILDAGAGRYLDRVSVHPYSFGWLPEAAELLAELRGLSAFLAARGVSPMLWVTEFGPQGDGEAHAAIAERVLVLLWQSRVVERWFYFTLWTPRDGTYSLFRPDWSAKPAAARYADAASRFDGMLPAGSALPADTTAPWGSGHPLALAPLQAWGLAGPVGRRERAVWAYRGEVRVGQGVRGAEPGKVYTIRPDWEVPGTAR